MKDCLVFIQNVWRSFPLFGLFGASVVKKKLTREAELLKDLSIIINPTVFTGRPRKMLQKYLSA